MIEVVFDDEGSDGIGEGDEVKIELTRCVLCDGLMIVERCLCLIWIVRSVGCGVARRKKRNRGSEIFVAAVERGSEYDGYQSIGLDAQ